MSGPLGSNFDVVPSAPITTRWYDKSDVGVDIEKGGMPSFLALYLLAKTRKSICEVYGESTIRRWFAKFKTGEFSLEADSRSGRPSKLDEDVLKTINFDVYCRQLANLNQKIKELRPEAANRKGVVFQYDNTRPHVSLATRTKLYELGWDILPHPPYSDIAPSDYHLFLSLQNSFQGKTFNDLDGVKMHLDNFFSSKPVKFYADGISKLPGRWAKGQHLFGSQHGSTIDSDSRR
ncbi:histone-lysine N-methyltransferase SETMAR-like [Octopus sinensis]|uniref:Histone-lysine N-methyltransferase SETMAR-like n=1 Tax=Octopus sinensis TaxID=2607531 RepID=A0A6P7U1S9_9MOLL|nr:histone-lysine N-methyltransferase SETMAR-like [Octopus sinensis]